MNITEAAGGPSRPHRTSKLETMRPTPGRTPKDAKLPPVPNGVALEPLANEDEVEPNSPSRSWSRNEDAGADAPYKPPPPAFR